MPICRKNGRTVACFFAEKEVAHFRDTTQPAKKNGLPKNRWIQIDMTPSGNVVSIDPAGLTGPGIQAVIKAARKELKYNGLVQ